MMRLEVVDWECADCIADLTKTKAKECPNVDDANITVRPAQDGPYTGSQTTLVVMRLNWVEPERM